MHNKSLTKQSLHYIYSKYAPHYETLATTQMSSIWIQRWMYGYLSVQEIILLITQGESGAVKGNRKRATSTRVRFQSRSTQKTYTLTQLCKNKHAGKTGTRMWGLIRIVLKCPMKIQNKATHNWLFYFIFIVLPMINITEFLQMHVYNLTCDQLWKTCLLDAYHENECPCDKRYPFICQLKHIHCWQCLKTT